MNRSSINFSSQSPANSRLQDSDTIFTSSSTGFTPAATALLNGTTTTLDVSGISSPDLPTTLWWPLSRVLSRPLTVGSTTPSPLLERLIIDGATVDGAAMAGVDEMLRAAKHTLKTLSAVGARGAAPPLLMALAPTRVEGVDLTDCGIASVVFAHATLPNTVKTLHISGNDLSGVAGRDFLAQTVRPGLRDVRAGRCRLEVNAALVMGDKLPRSVEILDLSQNSITAAGVTGLLARLVARYSGPPPPPPDAPMPQLRELIIGGNPLESFSPDILDTLASLLRVLPSLTHLSIGGCTARLVPPQSAALLARAVFAHPNLTVCDLTGWPFTPSNLAEWAAAAAAEAGPTSGCLRSLGLSPVVGAGAAAAAEGLRQVLVERTGVVECAAAGLGTTLPLPVTPMFRAERQAGPDVRLLASNVVSRASTVQPLITSPAPPAPAPPPTIHVRRLSLSQGASPAPTAAGGAPEGGEVPSPRLKAGAEEEEMGRRLQEMRREDREKIERLEQRLAKFEETRERLLALEMKFNLFEASSLPSPPHQLHDIERRLKINEQATETAMKTASQALETAFKALNLANDASVTAKQAAEAARQASATAKQASDNVKQVSDSAKQASETAIQALVKASTAQEAATSATTTSATSATSVSAAVETQVAEIEQRVLICEKQVSLVAKEVATTAAAAAKTGATAEAVKSDLASLKLTVESMQSDMEAVIDELSAEIAAGEATMVETTRELHERLKLACI